MPKFAVLVAILAAVLQIGYCLECYHCNDCESTSARKETCRDADLTSEVAGCMTKVVKDLKTNENMVIKRCHVLRHNEKKSCIPLPMSDEISCDICMDNLCNSAPPVTLNCLTMLVTAFTTILVSR